MKIKLLGVALLGFILIASSCSKKTDDKIEEAIGVTFTINIAGSNGDSYKAATAHGEMKDGHFVITSDHGDKEIYLYIDKFEKGKYNFSDTLNKATYSYEKSDPSKIYKSTGDAKDFVEITKIHSDNKTFDGKFEFTCSNSANDILFISGSWINVVKK